jgi:arginyl-tRNA synthetase
MEDSSSLSFRIRQIIFLAVKEAFGKEEKISFADIKIEHPKVENYGDYSTNLALVLAGRVGMKPFDIAEKLKNKLSEYIKTHHAISASSDSKSSSTGKIVVSDILENVTVAQPGFVNLTIKSDYLITLITQLLKSENGVITTYLAGKKIAVEYTDPNPFKEFHLGHLYSNVIGEAISRLFEACAASVWRADYYGDVGMHIAKSLYGLLTKLKIKNEKLKIEERPKNYEVDKMMECDVWVRPSIIVEIRADEITRSPVHTAGRIMGPSKSGNALVVKEAGFALRFPRLERFREDKSPKEATTLEEVKKMFEEQGNNK